MDSFFSSFLLVPSCSFFFLAAGLDVDEKTPLTELCGNYFGLVISCLTNRMMELDGIGMKT